MARKEREVKELVVQDDSNYIGSNLPVTQADFSNLSQQRKMLKDFVRNELVVDVDYGIIPGTPKPALYKPGAEKLKMLFGLSAKNILESEQIDRKENLLSYTYRCEISHLKTGRFVADCTGICDSQEKKYRERAVYKKKQYSHHEATPIADIRNTVSKMSQKRAFVGAIILATGASDFFTQDLEDYDDKPGAPVDRDADPVNSQFSDDERTKKLKGLLDSCRKVGISEKDICTKFKLVKALDLTDDQARELGGYGQSIKDGTKKVSEIFKAE